MPTIDTQSAPSTLVASARLTACQHEAVMRLEHQALRQGGVGLLEGPSGCGKTRVLASLARRLHRQGGWVVSFDLLARRETCLLWQLACGLGMACSREHSLTMLWRQVETGLQVAAIEQRPLALLGDDADELPAATQAALARCVSLAAWHGTALATVLATRNATAMAALLPHVRLTASLDACA